MRIAGPRALLGRLRHGGGATSAGFIAPLSDGFIAPGAAPAFSVIVAAYNVADVIGEALDSIRRQSLAPLEVIVCDDGSTDDLERALEPYREEIVFLHKENGGEASAKNAAARAAKGDFVLILDADDVYLPNRIAALTELARARPDLDILTSDALLVANNRPLRRLYDRSWSFEAEDQRRAILQRNFIFGHAAVRRDLFLAHGGFDESILWTTDWDLWLRMILGGSLAGCVGEPLALYRLREVSLTARRRDLALGRLATLEKACSNPDLREGDVPVLETSLRAYRRIFALEDLRSAVLAGEAGIRRRALKVLAAHGYPPRVRAETAAIATAPAVAARLLRRRAERSWVGAGGIRVRRAAQGRGGNRVPIS
jgi:glycosyltransferase involved in cell wall biosynthesis